jgi:hypothetical protein
LSWDPGWYLDPYFLKRERYWDGSAWTDQVRLINRDQAGSAVDAATQTTSPVPVVRVHPPDPPPSTVSEPPAPVHEQESVAEAVAEPVAEPFVEPPTEPLLRPLVVPAATAPATAPTPVPTPAQPPPAAEPLTDPFMRPLVVTSKMPATESTPPPPPDDGSSRRRLVIASLILLALLGVAIGAILASGGGGSSSGHASNSASAGGTGAPPPAGSAGNAHTADITFKVLPTGTGDAAAASKGSGSVDLTSDTGTLTFDPPNASTKQTVIFDGQTVYVSMGSNPPPPGKPWLSTAVTGLSTLPGGLGANFDAVEPLLEDLAVTAPAHIPGAGFTAVGVSTIHGTQVKEYSVTTPTVPVPAQVYIASDRDLYKIVIPTTVMLKGANIPVQIKAVFSHYGVKVSAAPPPAAQVASA